MELLFIIGFYLGDIRVNKELLFRSGESYFSLFVSYRLGGIGSYGSRLYYILEEWEGERRLGGWGV